MKLNIKSFWISRLDENIVENAADPDEEKEPDREGDSEETENGSKGIEKIDDEETHVIDLNTFLLLVWAWIFEIKYPCLNCDVSLL